MQQKQESQESVSDMNEVLWCELYNDNLGVNFFPQGIKGSQYSAGSELPSYNPIQYLTWLECQQSVDNDTFTRYTSSWGTYHKTTFVVRGYQQSFLEQTFSKSGPHTHNKSRPLFLLKHRPTHCCTRNKDIINMSEMSADVPYTASWPD